jgi:gliding motility-associated-like protein
MLMKKTLFTFLLFSTFLFSYSQRGNNWQFGFAAGLDFNSDTVTATNYSQMAQAEGSSSICDLNGKLLFYSDGIKVWNKNNIVMPNGTGLWGHMSSTQSCMIVPFPTDSNRYYIFTVTAQGGTKGFCYSVVNITLDGGQGDIEQKNIQLLTPTCEKITSVNHCNGKDVWVITHKFGQDKIYAYLINSSGIGSPIISSTGTLSGALGYLKASPDGTRLVNANYGNGLQLYDFNTATGIVSNKKEIYPQSNTYIGPYGVEFSPNSKILYFSHTRRSFINGWFHSELRQYRFLDSSVAKINSSKVVLGEDSIANIPGQYAALQLGPNGKIYLSIYLSSNSLSVINKPNLADTLCMFRKNSKSLAFGSGLSYGLPDLNQSYFVESFSHDSSCTVTSVNFFYSKPNNAISIKWDFGDPQSGINNNSYVDSPSHTFTTAGTYIVKAIVTLPCRNDTLKKIITINPINVNLGSDVTICKDSTLILDPHSISNNLSYLWQDNSTNQTLTASASGLYWVQVTNPINGCIVRDSLLLTNKPNPFVNLGSDTIICENLNLLLNAENIGANYTWQNNSNSPTFLVKNPGTYFVKVNLNGCFATDTIKVQIKYKPSVYLAKDFSICSGMTILLNPILKDAENASFVWNTGQVSPAITVSQTGNYTLTISNLCGSNTTNTIIQPGVCKFYIPSAFTPNNDGKNDFFKPSYGENVSDYSMEIFNRWGEKVFNSKVIQNGWGGRFKGSLQPSGSYTWLIRYRVYNDPVEYLLKGSVIMLY